MTLSIVKPPRMVLVQWKDSGLQPDQRWSSKAEYVAELDINALTVKTVGWLMHEDGAHLLVGLSHDATGDAYFGVQVIARENVISIDTLLFAYEAVPEDCNE